ncbi:MAG: hypothetical protein ACKO1G_20215, partial [Microcystis aeruginosa]
DEQRRAEKRAVEVQKNKQQKAEKEAKLEVWLFSTLCNKFNLYSSYRSLCPLCLCGSFHSLPQDCILEYILATKPKRAIYLIS